MERAEVRVRRCLMKRVLLKDQRWGVITGK